MIRLSAFADEISPALTEQIAVLQQERIHAIDLRSVWGCNVLDLNDDQVQQIKQALDEHDIKVAAIASPIGKAPIDASFTEQSRRLQRAIELAHIFQTRSIRLFSFYPPARASTHTNDMSAYRNEVITRLQAMTQMAEQADLILLHENEKEIYGDTLARNLDLLTSIESASWRTAFDPANYLQCHEQPYPAAYTALKPWITYVHVKDVATDGTLVPAGQGEANWPDLLQALKNDGYDGFLSLEPHLQSAGSSAGFSGPALFHTAVQALQNILEALDWSYT